MICLKYINLRGTNMEPYLYHGIRDFNLDKIINILKTGYIVKRKDLENKYISKDKNESDFNGENWISLSQKSLYDSYYGSPRLSSFDRFVYNHLCIVIKNNYKNLVYTNFVDFDMYSSSYFKKIQEEGNERYSTFMDEVQTKENIPISEFIAIGYPTKYFKYRKDVSSDIELIKNTLNEKKLLIPVIDSSFYDFADTEEKIKKYTL